MAGVVCLVMIVMLAMLIRMQCGRTVSHILPALKFDLNLPLAISYAHWPVTLTSIVSAFSCVKWER